ncbi:Hsp70 family protein [Mycobacterium sp. pV006]|uniref:Hsp70 family protein n=1 Tax=Mycobacterium sp. pV006 TaxID=3238983 RepID=UPI00351B9F4A
MRASLGLSLGAAGMAAVVDGRPTVRPTEVAVGPGPALTGFVERVGDPIPLVAADGSTHRAEDLAAAALEALTRTVCPQQRPDSVAVAVPAHWSEATVSALRNRAPHLLTVPDAAAALTALQCNPGLPDHGVVVLCDFGATGSSITLADAGRGLTPLAPTLRDTEFSGDLIDQALLRHVLDGLEPDPAATSEVAALVELRDHCRIAKEQLSTHTATGLTVGGRTVRVTRSELEGLLAAPLDRFVTHLADALYRNGVAPARVSALATVGGGARIPAVTERLSQAMRVPVVTVAAAQVVAAAGAELIARRRLVVEPATMLAPTSAADDTMAAPPVAWSDEPDDLVEPVPYEAAAYARPDVHFDEYDSATGDVDTLAWYRRPGVLFAGAACLAALATTGLVLTSQARPAEQVTADTARIEVPAARPVQEPPVQEPVGPAPQTVTATVAAPAPVPAARQPAPPPPLPVTKQAAPQSVPVAPAPVPVPAPAPVPVVVLPVPVAPGPSATPTPSASPSPTPTPTASPSPTRTPTPTASPSPTQTPTPTASPSPTQAPTPTASPSPTQAPTPTQAPSPEPAAPPQTSVAPSAEPAQVAETAPVTEAAPEPVSACEESSETPC